MQVDPQMSRCCSSIGQIVRGPLFDLGRVDREALDMRRLMPCGSHDGAGIKPSRQKAADRHVRDHLSAYACVEPIAQLLSAVRGSPAAAGPIDRWPPLGREAYDPAVADHHRLARSKLFHPRERRALARAPEEGQISAYS